MILINYLTLILNGKYLYKGKTYGKISNSTYNIKYINYTEDSFLHTEYINDAVNSKKYKHTWSVECHLNFRDDEYQFSLFRDDNIKYQHTIFLDCGVPKHAITNNFIYFMNSLLRAFITYGLDFDEVVAKNLVNSIKNTYTEIMNSNSLENNELCQYILLLVDTYKNKCSTNDILESIENLSSFKIRL